MIYYHLKVRPGVGIEPWCIETSGDNFCNGQSPQKFKIGPGLKVITIENLKIVKNFNYNICFNIFMKKFFMNSHKD